jgi:hypothetical protein
LEEKILFAPQAIANRYHLRSDTLVRWLSRDSLLGRDFTTLIYRLLSADYGAATRKQYGDIE